ELRPEAPRSPHGVVERGERRDEAADGGAARAGSPRRAGEPGRDGTRRGGAGWAGGGEGGGRDGPRGAGEAGPGDGRDHDPVVVRVRRVERDPRAVRVRAGDPKRPVLPDPDPHLAAPRGGQ